MNIEDIKLFLRQIEGENAEACLRMLIDHKSRLIKAPGSSSKHQAWEGGYICHLLQVMEQAVLLYSSLVKKYKLPFTLSDVLLVLWLHDLEKPFCYVEPRIKFVNEQVKKKFVLGMVDEYGVCLTDEHLLALKYIHGEGADFSLTERRQSPLGAFCHVCDTISARILHDEHCE